MGEIVNLRRACAGRAPARKPPAAVAARCASGVSAAEREAAAALREKERRCGSTAIASTSRKIRRKNERGDEADDGAVVKHSLAVAGHSTSVSLERLFWTELRRAAAERGQPVSACVAEIDAGRGKANLSSAIRDLRAAPRLGEGRRARAAARRRGAGRADAARDALLTKPRFMGLARPSAGGAFSRPSKCAIPAASGRLSMRKSGGARSRSFPVFISRALAKEKSFRINCDARAVATCA